MKINSIPTKENMKQAEINLSRIAEYDEEE